MRHLAFPLALLVAVACEAPPQQEAASLSAAGLLAHIEKLASDEFEGRGPGSFGEEKTIQYLSQTFRDYGLAPGNPDGSFVQKVPLVGITASEPMTMSFEKGGSRRSLELRRDFVAWTKRVVENVEVDREMIFVGYGAVAPEYDWDDFKDVDVRDKVLVMLVNDPPVGDLFGGKAMTYYGRWTYKFEKAAERGAAGAFIVHETEPAGYPWEVVVGSWTGEQFDLVTEDKNLGRAAVEGWIQRDQAVALFEMAGLDFEESKKAAADPSFRPVPLPVRARLSIHNTLRQLDSANVVARREGGAAADEWVVYMAHWDHLGKDETLPGDTIYNGALDNATGTAGLLELARSFAALVPPPRRSVLFLAVTAEEQGLLGSRYYATHPLYPAEKTVAAINMDGLNVWGRTSDLTVVGMGQSSLDDLAERLARKQNRTLRPDAEPEKGFYYRSDHFEFAKVGIPAFYPDAGVSFLGKPEGWGLEMRKKYTAEDYHKSSDQVKDFWDLAGALEDLELFYQMGLELATGSDWPSWSPTSEFRALRKPPTTSP